MSYKEKSSPLPQRLLHHPRKQSPLPPHFDNDSGGNGNESFKPIVRTYSGPWLQKPIHASTLNSTSHEPSATGSSSSSPTSAYNSINFDEDQSINPRNSSSSGNNNQLQRHLSLFDLVSIGIGATIGSGIFVLCGFIARNYAGPATCISWAISGTAACLSGVCYAELACRMPSAGSSYVYVYASMGELPAVIVAGCLMLEYVVSASAVARSWGDKVLAWMHMELGVSEDESSFSTWLYHPEYNFNLMATLISIACVVLLLNGVKESKTVANFFTMTKVAVVVFMAVMGMILMKPKQNLVPFVPPQFGMAGIFRGATSSFFGYIGFDGICCIAGEAKNPQKNMPLAIVLVLGGVTALYICAALALTGMESYQEIDEVSGFPAAFHSTGVHWAAQLSAFGEIFTLPIVVLISFLAQPRLQYALAKDGLLPEIFARVDETGNLWHGTFLSGIVMVITAAFVPFAHLNDMISAGVLISFCMTDSSLVLLRHESPKSRPGLVEKLLGLFNLTAFVTSVALTHFLHNTVGALVAVLSGGTMVMCLKMLYTDCPPVSVFGGKKRESKRLASQIKTMDSEDYFTTPLLPFVPCFGIFVNWYLISQLELLGIGLLLGYLTITTIFYFSYGLYHSVGNRGGWVEYNEGDYVDEEYDADEDMMLTSEASLHGVAIRSPKIRSPFSLNR